ncbi:bifunctional adenosylcobinamide kinase/adenosylcobinamide-phosphate guanylyltransferase [Mycolicibacterium fluoranthenivorans]|uniref:Adenosylcobinamide kinase n=1 Tax=Mycolicibacterium fluoranthenivorans TaxID=258505 RepID=A0A1G4VB42_9MYCO|nr:MULTISPECIES: bifunctional adenosylcobinamide kinase/adenosylcobinamide-phosphate guanylyltransferase [Mycobacteriaceae]MCV7254557.1 bifunctional adenosylcobinamide kinase/adenosylcobinamide-phosphate guanylyltransferase [Mycobacterium hackensackense]QNJ91297.1 bifunctional adenosylcobinamide kinase/adenosylcobinamide-phosphate guanylyltransferase [Mycolicibacterium fluoranthenivorans]SCX04024.1 adenosylcobinamide kinase /adenosylcobinamide-phosphate guanylyltransferase [Mycolicibacterium flu
MRVLVLGGIRSGKSHWAEAAISDTAGEPVRYVATGRTDPADPEWSRRVDTHRSRRPAHWSTVETTDVATELRADPRTPTLVDDIGGWLTATMDRLGAWTGGSVRTDIDEPCDELCAAITGFDGKLTLVSPEVGLTVVPATAGGRLFADELGTLNQRLAALCDRVVLVVAGQPLVVKEAR